MALAEQPQQLSQSQSAPHTNIEQRAEQFHEERRYIVRSPVPRYYAFLVALLLLPLGLLGFIPQFTVGGVLFGILRVTPLANAVYLITSVAGFAAFAVRRGHYAHLFTLVMTGVYLLMFSSGNIAFGNVEGASGGPLDFPWILENALHAGLMLTGALVTGLAALQQGDRATAREFKQQYGIIDRRPESVLRARVEKFMARLRHPLGVRRHAESTPSVKDRLSSLARSCVVLLAATILSLLFATFSHVWHGRARKR